MTIKCGTGRLACHPSQSSLLPDISQEVLYLLYDDIISNCQKMNKNKINANNEINN